MIGFFGRAGSAFQSTLPQGKWLGWLSEILPLWRFQSTLPQGKWRHSGKCMDLIVYDFNPHFRKGSDSTERAKTDEPYDFNPHFRKGSDCIISRIEQKWNYFNPHFRKGSDEGKWIIPSSVHISIHTSAREVTKCKQYRRINSLFQSTLPQGKWQIDWINAMGIFDFNPHFHKGSDSSEYLQQYIDRYFNPHFHKGSDSNIPQKHLSIFMKYL